MSARPSAEAPVPTARGSEISSSSLGFTLMHEHTFTLSPEINQNYPDTLGDEEQLIAAAVHEYSALKAAGVDTLVDLTVIGLGRFIPRVKRIAEAVDLNIIVATGVYIWDALPMFFTVRAPGTMSGGPETMDDLFVRDIEEGIGNTAVRAGILKVATDKYGLTPGVERVLRATASAHRRTGVPISTHTATAENGLQQQRVFIEEGVDLARVVIGHIEHPGSESFGDIERILNNGSFIGIDRFGLPLPGVTDELRVDLVVELCRRGYAEQIVMSQDHACFCDMIPPEWYVQMPNWRKTFLLETIIPRLLDRGVSQAQIDQMMKVNPSKVFATRALGAY
jgi:phosphotriesterase-related protein